MSGTKVALIPPHGAVAIQEKAPKLIPEAALALDQAGFFAPREHSEYALTVLTSTGCNLGCGYCFQNVHSFTPGTLAPNRIPLNRLTEPIIDDILSFTRGAMAQAGLERLKILLFGGEPLLNSASCLALLEKASKCGLVDAHMISNGTLLTADLARQLEERLLSKIQITFDGDRTTHDAIRATRTGRGTFDTILANIAKVSAATELRWQFRFNVSHRNRFSVPDLIEMLARHVEPERCTIDIALINDVGIGYHNHLAYNDDFRDEYLSWHLAILQRGFSLRPPEAEFFCSYCSLRRGEIGAVVNADGTLYSCWETVGRPDMHVGHVRDGYLPDEIIEERWHRCGYNAASHGIATDATRFQDFVDAAILDELRGRSLLTKR